MSACGSEPAETGTAPSMPVVETPSQVGLELPAVWNTSDLQGTVSQLALAGGAASVLAVVYEDGALELFDLEADRISAVADMDVAMISNGAYADFGDVALAVFPGVGEDGALAAYVFGAGLDAPQKIDLGIKTGGRVAGLCSRGRTYQEGGLLDLTYWTVRAPETAIVGQLESNAGDFTFDGEAMDKPAAATACAFQAEGPVFLGDDVNDLAVLDRPGSTNYVGLKSNGSLIYRRGAGAFDSLGLRDGISVRVPDPIADIAALGMAFGGGYPEGLIVVAGPVDGRDQVVFVDAGALTRAPEVIMPAEDALD
ncbi:MAG: hypothetical protein MRY64_15495 [Hyphomonadaceae bacterium]|nr:hypothetical protein [Hyphomonadaceae bacterium]